MDASNSNPDPGSSIAANSNHQPENLKPKHPSSHASYKIIPARSPEDIQIATSLFTAYTTALGIDLTFQNFSTEISSMPGKYAPPDGEILLAIDDGNDSNNETEHSYTHSLNTNNVLGCVGLRPLKPTFQPSFEEGDLSKRYCEMKRLYVTPSARGRGVGRALVNAIIDVAKSKGYDEMRLDTLDDMHAPIAVYKSVGFLEVGPYYETPLKNTVFLGLEL